MNKRIPESAEIIKNHVEEGIRIARKYHLPSRIDEFIREHHGTTCLEVFLAKAKAMENSTYINDKEFRYSGPKPRSRETVLLHIADSISATIKSLQDINRDNIRKVVNQIIDKRLQDGQFDEAPLTFSYLSSMKECIVEYYDKKFIKKRVDYDKEKAKYARDNQSSSGQAT